MTEQATPTALEMESQVASQETPEVSPEDNTDWKSEATKFQSGYDSLQSIKQDYGENYKDQLKGYNQLQSALQEDPQGTIKALSERFGVKGEETKEVNLEDSSEFDTFDPKSVRREIERIAEAKASEKMTGLEKEFRQYQQNQALQQVRDELVSQYGVTDKSLQDEFLEFATTPREQLGLPVLWDVFSKLKKIDLNAPTPNMEQVNRTQGQAPQTAGIFQGGDAPQPDAEKAMRKRIVDKANEESIF